MNLISKNTQDRTPRRPSGRIKVLGLLACATALVAPTAAQAGGGGVTVGGSGGSNGGKTVAGKKAKLRHGKAIAPKHAPAKVKRAIRAGNRIAGKPYKYGGGHARWKDSGYDCSGAVSYTLGKPGAKKLKAPMPSGSFNSYGRKGRGKWITTYSNGGHMYVMIAGLRFESHSSGNGPGWAKQKATKSGYVQRHPKGL